MKWCPTSYKMAPDKLENGPQCCFSMFDCMYFISNFLIYISFVSFTLSHFTKSSPNLLQVLQPLSWHCVESVIHHKRDIRQE